MVTQLKKAAVTLFNFCFEEFAFLMVFISYEMLHIKIWHQWEVGFSFMKWKKGDFEKRVRNEDWHSCLDLWQVFRQISFGKGDLEVEGLVAESLKTTFTREFFGNFLCIPRNTSTLVWRMLLRNTDMVLDPTELYIMLWEMQTSKTDKEKQTHHYNSVWWGKYGHYENINEGLPSWGWEAARRWHSNGDMGGKHNLARWRRWKRGKRRRVCTKHKAGKGAQCGC